MGRIKNDIADRNRLNLAKRYSIESSGVSKNVEQESGTEPRPSLPVGLQGTGQATTSATDDVDPVEPMERSHHFTRFALCNS